ncbi:MAG: alanine racemase, partial [Clostridiales bacterium GWB2_37_7]
MKEVVQEVIRLDINLSQLQRNVKRISLLIRPEVKLMAVVKGNAYGHGLVHIAKALEDFGCHSLGVVRITEALALRDAGINAPIVMLAPIMPSQIEEAVKNDLTIMLDNVMIAVELNKYAQKYKKMIKVHIKVNTGLNRFGINAEEVPGFIRSIKESCIYLEIEGIYTHFRDPEFNKPFTDTQIAIFNDVLIKLEKEGLRPAIAHAAASGGILMYPEAHYDMIRCGILLYGEEYLKGEQVMPEGVLPLTSLVSRVIKINEVQAGQPIGYGDRHIAVRKCRIAVIAGGYGDGVSRGWKQILINGQKAPIVNYAMDCLEADITDIEGIVQVYDEAVLIGRQGNEAITWENACNGLNSEVDEQLQRITSR